MQFSVLAIAATAISASLALAAPAVQARQGPPVVTVTFTGADPPAFFTQDIPISGKLVPITTDPESLSVSYISWTVPNLGCSFIGTHDGAATGVAVEISYGNEQYGPPQPVTQAECHYLS